MAYIRAVQSLAVASAPSIRCARFVFGFVVCAGALAGCTNAPDRGALRDPIEVQVPPSRSVAVHAPGFAPRPSFNDEIAGHYRAPHTVFVVCDDPDGCEVEVADDLDVANAPGGALQIAVEVVQANAHLCAWGGRLDRTRERVWESVEPDCTVRLEASDTQIAITSEGCRDYCGARAILETTFARGAREGGSKE